MTDKEKLKVGLGIISILIIPQAAYCIVKDCPCGKPKAPNYVPVKMDMIFGVRAFNEHSDTKDFLIELCTVETESIGKIDALIPGTEPTKGVVIDKVKSERQEIMIPSFLPKQMNGTESDKCEFTLFAEFLGDAHYHGTSFLMAEASEIAVKILNGDTKHHHLDMVVELVD